MKHTLQPFFSMILQEHKNFIVSVEQVRFWGQLKISNIFFESPRWKISIILNQHFSA